MTFSARGKQLQIPSSTSRPVRRSYTGSMWRWSAWWHVDSLLEKPADHVVVWQSWVV